MFLMKIMSDLFSTLQVYRSIGRYIHGSIESANNAEKETREALTQVAGPVLLHILLS